MLGSLANEKGETMPDILEEIEEYWNLSWHAQSEATKIAEKHIPYLLRRLKAAEAVVAAWDEWFENYGKEEGIGGIDQARTAWGQAKEDMP